MLFHKKKEGKDEETSPLDKSYPKPPEETLSQHNSDGPNMFSMSADMERMKGQLAALFESKKIDAQRFEHINQTFGEQRKSILSHEKEIGKIDAAATKASELVQQVQPQNLMLEVKKLDARIQAIEERLNSTEAVNGEIRKELQNARLLINKFRGINTIIDQSKEVQKDTFNLKKIGAKIRGDADKVTNIFAEMNKKYAQFEKFKDIADDNSKTNNHCRRMSSHQVFLLLTGIFSILSR